MPEIGKSFRTFAGHMRKSDKKRIAKREETRDTILVSCAVASVLLAILQVLITLLRSPQ